MGEAHHAIASCSLVRQSAAARYAAIKFVLGHIAGDNNMDNSLPSASNRTPTREMPAAIAIPPHGPFGNGGADAALRFGVDKFHVAQKRRFGIGRIDDLHQPRVVAVELRRSRPRDQPSIS